ncbi:MAG: hypothetical protein NVSMB53_01460 [Gemmatimonadaceae bacterium]
MAEDDYQPRVVALRGKFDAADLRRSDDVAGDADDEQVAQALIEYDLRRNARIRASEDDRDRLLPARKLDATGVTYECVGSAHIGDEPEITLAQPLECFVR